MAFKSPRPFYLSVHLNRLWTKGKKKKDEKSDLVNIYTCICNNFTDVSDLHLHCFILISSVAPLSNAFLCEILYCRDSYPICRDLVWDNYYLMFLPLEFVSVLLPPLSPAYHFFFYIYSWEMLFFFFFNIIIPGMRFFFYKNTVCYAYLYFAERSSIEAFSQVSWIKKQIP